MREALRRASAMIILWALALLGASLAGGGSCRAIEIPYREILFGTDAPSHLGEFDSFQSLFARWETRFWELYRVEEGDHFQDYHQLDSRVSALARSAWLLYGFEVDRNELSLKQSNAYTDADRMSGGRTLARGDILLGADGTLGRVPGNPRGRALGAAGWGAGVEASLDAMLSWKERAFVSVRAATGPTEIAVYEEINGHRFPFRFPFRTDGIEAESAILARGFQLAAALGLNVSHGDDTDTPGFGNALYFRRISFGASIRRGIRMLPGDDSVLRRLGPGSSFPGCSLTLALDDGNGDIGMERGGVRYLHLQDANVDDTSVRLDFVPAPSVNFSIGWQRLRIQHDGASFLDVWPFSIWDVFSAKRYRLGRVDGRIDTWHLGGGCIARSTHFEAELQARFEHIDDSFSLRWYEREDILFPFIFTYVAYDEAPSIQYRYALQLEPALSIRATDRFTITLSGSGILPFGLEQEEKEEPAHPAPSTPQPKEKRSNRGGLLGVIVLTYAL